MLKEGAISIYNGAMPKNIDVALIRTFIATADHGNMTVAANRLHMTQSAIGKPAD